MYICENYKMPRYIIITDLEPDDQMALIIASVLIPANEIYFIGATVLHSGQKKILAENVLQELDYKVPVIQGAGGKPNDYEDIVSSRAAREYCHGINTTLHHTSDDLKDAIKMTLSKNENVEFVLLAEPTDLVLALHENQSLKRSIKHIHMMGGWITKGETNWTTYNWNMGPSVSASLIEMSELPMTIYSSHMIKPAFLVGSINRANHPKLIERIDELLDKVPALKSHRTASTNWNNHLIKKIPALAKVIGSYCDHQFTPADPIVIMCLVYPDIIIRKNSATLKMHLTDKDSNCGYHIDITNDKSSQISIIEQIDVDKFIAKFHEVLDRLEKSAAK